MKTLLHGTGEVPMEIESVFFGYRVVLTGYKVRDGVEILLKNQFLLCIIAFPSIFWKGFFNPTWPYGI
ncbi:hypothetical protein [Cyclobacterium sp.]|uniref:hypothetical protein n=1 Tax=Cyclobacterium sp. TaxID=1966343 RepID=UPI0019C0279A|nr:hypothetical protein [Cyclobacterium sp.]MBD3631312.1 hypothetical protein [Cyclobacterium sp.]